MSGTYEDVMVALSDNNNTRDSDKAEKRKCIQWLNEPLLHIHSEFVGIFLVSC